VIEQAHKPAPRQKRHALVSGVVLALTALAIYGVVILKMVAPQ
jgi:hypothetical protein